MADKFVWSGATGANDGSTWEDAYTTLMRDWGAEGTFTPGTDFVYVRDSHAESAAGPLTVTGSAAEGTVDQVRVLCVVGADTGTAPGNLSTGASVTATGTTDINIDEGIYIYGVDFFASNDISVGDTGSDHDITLEQLRLELTGVDAGDSLITGSTATTIGKKITWIDVTLDFGAAGQGIQRLVADVFWIGGSVDFDVNALFNSVARAAQTLVSGVDFSTMTSSYLIPGATNVSVSHRTVFSRCILPTGGTIVNGTIDVPGYVVEAYHCQIGTDADPAYQMEIHSDRGSITTDTSRYRTGGASDGERTNPISWDMNTSNGSKRNYPGHALESNPIAEWTDGDASTAHTYRIYFASDATINDDELWFDLIGPNDAATNSLGVRKTTRVAPRTTASAYTTDGTSTWSGSGVTTKQQMDITYTPDKPGPIEARVYLAKDSDNVYIDPKIYIDP